MGKNIIIIRVFLGLLLFWSVLSPAAASDLLDKFATVIKVQKVEKPAAVQEPAQAQAEEQAVAELPVEAVQPVAEGAPLAEPAAQPVVSAPPLGESISAETGLLFAEPQGTPDMDNLITLDLRGMDIRDALKYVAVNGGINIVLSQTVGGSITFMLKDVPVREVFDVLLRSNSLAYEQQGNIYTVMTESEYQQRYGKAFADRRTVKAFRLQYAIPENALTLINGLKSEIGSVVVDTETGTVLVIDGEQKLAEIEEAIAVLEQADSVQVFDLKYARALDVEERLKTSLDAKKVGTIRADERSNQVVVQTLPERMKTVGELISSLDQKTKEVLIDSQIVRVTLSDDSDVGIEWEGLMQVLTRSGGVDFLGSHPYASLDKSGVAYVDDYATRVAATTNLDPRSRIFTSTVAPQAGRKTGLTENIYFGKTNRWEAVMRFLETVGKTKIMANPKIVVLNNQEAKIHVGRREVYVTTTITAGTTTTTTSEEVNFVDVGVQLAVTPTINADGFVTMKIKPEISAVVDTVLTPSNNVIPVIATQTAESTVIVKDNTTIILGGLRSDERVTSSKEIPFFSKLPFLGEMTKQKTTDKEHTEVLILITPHIISGDSLVTGDLAELGTEATK
ncbi:MAG: secretin N-terminal domain-containing protein [Candidatus Omnitrophota bacterium]